MAYWRTQSAPFCGRSVGAFLGSRGTRGFTLLEVVIAVLLTTTSVLGLARLLVAALESRSNTAATTVAVTLAHDKMEQLRGLFWGFAADGAPAADMTSDLVRGLSTGGTGLALSPEDTLDRDVDGFCDYVDARGRRLGGGTRPAGTAFVRRWRIRPAVLDSQNLLELQVRVLPVAQAGGSGAVVRGRPGGAAVATLRVRQVEG